MHPLDFMTWLRMGRPSRGAIESHAQFAYPFEEGAEVPLRLHAAFGDLTRLAAADLGSGASDSHVGSQVFNVPWRRLVSVEAFGPYVKELRTKRAAAAQHEIQATRVESFIEGLAPGELDLAIAIDVLEHFDRRRALSLLRRVESLFSVGCAIFVPVGTIDQDPYDGNELQLHRSTWRAKDLARLGYEVTLYKGLHGQLDPAVDAAWAIKRWG